MGVRNFSFVKQCARTCFILAVKRSSLQYKKTNFFVLFLTFIVIIIFNGVVEKGMLGPIKIIFFHKDSNRAP